MRNTEESGSLINPLQTQIALYNEEPETLTREEALSYWKLARGFAFHAACGKPVRGSK
jgi:hypothetical protein